MKAQEAFIALKEKFKNAKISAPEIEASWLLEHFAGMGYIEQLKTPDRPIDEKIAGEIDAAVERRLTGEPLAYILGYKDFFSNRFTVNGDVLIPRPETEHLVEWAINWLQDRTTRQEEFRILDMGTGSGCIAISVVKFFKNVSAIAIDTSEEALLVARQNAASNGVATRIEFRRLAAAAAAKELPGETFDLVLANPPYIDPKDRRVEPGVRNFEPAEALFAGENGMQAIRQWLAQAVQLVSEKGGIAFEIGSDQSRAALQLARDLNGFSKQYILKDLAGFNRVLCLER